MTDHNRRSKMLTQSLAAKYLEAQNDPELLSNRLDLSLLEVRLGQLLQRIESGDYPNAWKDVQNKFEEYKLAAQDGSAAKMMAIEHEIQSIFDARERDQVAWMEVYTLLEQRRKLGESEQKRLVAMSQMITAEDAMKLIAQLMSAVKKHIGKPPDQAYAAIAYEFAILAGDANRTGIPIGSPEDNGTDRSPGMDQ